MDTIEKTDDQVLADLEHAPECELQTQGVIGWYRWSFNVGGMRDCHNKARWIGQVPCCGETMFACDRCYQRFTNPDNEFVCCGRDLPVMMITWSRI